MTGKQLKEHLYQHKIKQYVLAEKMGVTAVQVNHYTKSTQFMRNTEEKIRAALIDLGHPFKEPKPVSTFGSDKTDHTTLVRLTDLQREVNTLRELVNSQKRIITLLEEKLERSLPNLA